MGEHQETTEAEVEAASQGIPGIGDKHQKLKEARKDSCIEVSEKPRLH